MMCKLNLLFCIRHTAAPTFNRNQKPEIGGRGARSQGQVDRSDPITGTVPPREGADQRDRLPLGLPPGLPLGLPPTRPLARVPVLSYVTVTPSPCHTLVTHTTPVPLSHPCHNSLLFIIVILLFSFVIAPPFYFFQPFILYLSGAYFPPPLITILLTPITKPY